MNKSYVSIWSEALGSWVAASEHTARRGKRSKSRCVMGSIGVALGVIAGYSGNAAANVTNPIGAYGNIAINNSTITSAAASASTPGSIAIGAGANAKGDVDYDGSSAIAIGDSAKANGGGAIALGEMAVVNGDRSAAFGPASTVSASNSVALGFGSTVTATNSVALGVNSVADRANTVSVGATTGQRQIVNLAAGTQSTDAVNLSQLGGVVNALGGGAAIKSDGTISAPSYSVGGTTVNNVGDAVANIDENVRRNASKMDNLNDGLVMIHNIALDNSNDIAINKADITKMSGDITNVTNNLNDGTIGLVQHDAATRNITVAKDLDGTTVDFSGTDGARTLSGVKAGALGDTSTEAVNGSQLHATNQNVTTNTAGIAANATNVATNRTAITSIDGRVTNVEGSVTNLTQQLDGGSVGLVQQDATSKAITVARGLDGTTVDFSGTDGVRTLSGVKAGALGDTSTEAVNGSQLHATNQNVTTNAASIADNATNVAANRTAITSIDGRVTNVEGSVTNLTQQLDGGSVGLVQQDATSKAITVARGLDGTTVDFSGTDGVRTLSGVKAGALGDTSTEAVNGSQLHATNQNVTTNAASIADNATNVAANRTAITSIDGRVTNVEGSVTNLTQQLDGGSVGLVQQDATSKAITVARGLDGTTVDFSGTAGVRTLGGVKAGALGDTSTEAVNGSQLHTTNQNVTTNTAGIAANTTNVAANKTAITSIDGRVTNVEGSVTNLTQQLDGGSVGLVQQDATSKVITVARGLDGTTVDFSGTDGARTLSGVAEGAIAAGSKEAVNGSQLYANSASVAAGLGGGSAVNADGTISAPSYSVGGTTVHSVGDAVTNLDDRVTENTTDITKLQTQVGDVGTQLSGAVQYDRHADGSVNFGSVTLGGSLSAGPVILSNVANGTSQYDAVNFGQLSALQDQVTDLDGQVKDLGSQLSNIQPVTPDVSSPDRNNDAVANAATPGTGVGSTVAGANASATADNAVAVGSNAAATGGNSTAIGTGSQAGNANSVALGQGSVTDRDNSVSVGSVGHERQITNVAAGTVDTDAVNVGQMNSSVAQGVQQANNYTDQRINATNQAINDVAKNAYAGIAAAMAMPNMTPSGPGKTIVAAGGATYKGGSAAAVGATYRSRNNKWLVNAAVSVTSTGDAGARAQVGYEF
ncbi:autotransporter adhesin [Paraburkholderia sp. WC7.3g]